MAEKTDGGETLIGVCVDSSEHSDRAFAWYRDHWHRDGYKVAIIHVHVPPPLPTVPYHQLAGPVILSDRWLQTVERSLEESRSLLHGFEAKCKEAKIPYALVTETRGDDIGEGICHVASKMNLSALIIGNRGLGTVRRTFLGSVSDYIVHHAHCPVTVVPPPHK